MNKVKEIYEILQNDRIPLTAQSFAALFECIGRLPAHNATSCEVLKEFVEEMTQKVRFSFY
jgi:hypothetical protein